MDLAIFHLIANNQLLDTPQSQGPPPPLSSTVLGYLEIADAGNRIRPLCEDSNMQEFLGSRISNEDKYEKWFRHDLTVLAGSPRQTGARRGRQGRRRKRDRGRIPFLQLYPDSFFFGVSRAHCRNKDMARQVGYPLTKHFDIRRFVYIIIRPCCGDTK